MTVPGTIDSLRPIARYVVAAASAAGLGRRSAYRLRLAVDEVATNIITHGYAESGLVGDVVVRADLDERALTITLEDSGASYTPDLGGRPDQIAAPPEERPIGGLGKYLAVRSVDEIKYERAHGRNRHILVVRRVTTGPSGASS